MSGTKVKSVLFARTRVIRGSSTPVVSHCSLQNAVVTY